MLKVDPCEIAGVPLIVTPSCDSDSTSALNAWNLKKESNFLLTFWCMSVANFFKKSACRSLDRALYRQVICWFVPLTADTSQTVPTGEQRGLTVELQGYRNMWFFGNFVYLWLASNLLNLWIDMCKLFFGEWTPVVCLWITRDPCAGSGYNSIYFVWTCMNSNQRKMYSLYIH